MSDEAIKQAKETWTGELKEELEKRSGRRDIEVTVAPYCSYDVLVSAGADKHPIVDFYAAIQGDSPRVAAALDYAAEMLQNWEVAKIIHEKAKQDCRPFYERLKSQLPDIELVYNVFDFDKHYVRVEKIQDKTVAAFDLWPTMTEGDVNRLAFYIKDYEATLRREKATWAGMTYWWK
jgi:hypothetical protein